MNVLTAVENEPSFGIASLMPQHTNPGEPHFKNIFFDNLQTFLLSNFQGHGFNSKGDAKNGNDRVPIHQSGTLTDLPLSMNETSLLFYTGSKTSPCTKKENNNNHPPSPIDIMENQKRFSDNVSGLCVVTKKLEVQVDEGEHASQGMILPEDISPTPGNNTQVPLNENSLKSLTDNELPFPFEVHVQGEQLEQREQREITAKEHYCTPKNFQTTKIFTDPFATVTGEKTVKTLLESSRMIILQKSITPTFDDEPQSLFNNTSMKSITANGISSLVEELSEGKGLMKNEQGKAPSPDKVSIGTENIFFSIENKNGKEYIPIKLQVLQEPSKVDHINDDTFITAKSGDASIKVSLEPDGIGKIDIKLVLDRGVINAQINTSETIGKEFIEKNLHNILSSLINEGLNIGSFSVSLRNKGGEMKDDGNKEDIQVFRVIEAAQLPFTPPHKGIVNIFV